MHHWNIMTYDYYVSDIKTASYTAPNQPLHTVEGDKFVNHWSVADTVKAYEDAGATKSKMNIGLAFYAHSWFVPGLDGDEWKKFGLPA